MRSHGPASRLAAIALATVTFACSGDLTQEEARLAAEKAQTGLQPLDAGALSQEVSEGTVKRAQEQLTALKEYIGPINGKLDQVTLNALEAFQRAHDIVADGRFNQKTLDALNAATKS